jgi:pyruvate kinase
MDNSLRRTKIVATIGPASSSPEVLRKMIQAGMNVARLNFSHGSYEDHAATIANIRAVAQELDTPITLLQDLQGPKIRVGHLPGGQRALNVGDIILLVPQAEYREQPDAVPIDYPHAAEEAKAGMQVLLDDGLLELEVMESAGTALRCKVVEGGVLKDRKGVNFPSLNLRLPSMTEKDKQDLDFGLAQDVDWVSLSFVRSGEDIRALKALLAERGKPKPVIAKIEKPQAVEHLEEILDEATGVMVARGDLGVEMKPETVPMMQKRIIEQCNRRGMPVITATQMLESMIREPRPTRAEASDVANAIIDGTDAVMLSGESAVGAFPVRAVAMLDRIAREVESRIEFKSYPPAAQNKNVHALGAAANVLARELQPRCIVALTVSGVTAQCIAAERPASLVVSITTNPNVFHALNLVWGIKPLLVDKMEGSFESLVKCAERTLLERRLVKAGDTILVLGGIPAGAAGGSNFIKMHVVAEEGMTKSE